MIQKKTTRLTHVFALMGLLCLCAVLLLSGCGKKQDVETPSVDSDVESALDQIDITAVPAAESASEAAEPGTLLESGTNLNENYYAEVSYFGMASDLTDSERKQWLLERMRSLFLARLQSITTKIQS